MSNKAYIISLAPYIVTKAQLWFGPCYHVEARKEGQEYSVTEISSGSSFKDFGENQKEFYRIEAEDIAADLIRGSEMHGVFVSPTPVPAPDALAEAKKTQRKFYESLIEDGDSIFGRTGDHKQVPFHARVAARELNVRRDWASDYSAMEPCKACHELISMEAAKCPKCHAIVNWEAALMFGLLTEEQIRFATKRGLIAATDSDEATPVPAKDGVSKKVNSR